MIFRLKQLKCFGGRINVQLVGGGLDFINIMIFPKRKPIHKQVINFSSVYTMNTITE